MESAIVDFNSVSTGMSGYAKRLNKVNSVLSTDNSMRTIRSNISSRVNAINTVAETSSKVRKCFERIHTEYINSERAAYQKLYENRTINIGGKGRFANLATVSSLNPLSKWRVSWTSLLSSFGIGSATKIYSWSKINWGFLTPIINWIKNPFGKTSSKWGNFKPEPYIEPRQNRPANWVSYSREEERANDIKMQSETKDLVKTAQEKWKTASYEEKKVILNELLKDTQKVMGTSVNPELRIYKMSSTGTRGYYHLNNRHIAINEHFLTQSDSSLLLKTVVHEVRHSYQQDVAFYRKNHLVSDETRQAWASNFPPPDSNYYSGFDHTRYLTQPVEWDSKHFAGQQHELVGLTPQYAGSW